MRKRFIAIGIGLILLSAFIVIQACKTMSPDGSSVASDGSLQGAAARNDFIKTARIWEKPKQAIGSQDLSAMAPICGDFIPGDTVTCTYLPPKRDGGGAGWTPKFKCVDAQKRKLKIKYGVTSAEVFHEAFAARFLQALGFKADCDYPVGKVICENCPAEPFTYTNLYRISQEDPNEVMDTRVFDAAMVEIPFSPNTMSADIDNETIEGWGFDEMLSAPLQSTDPQQKLAREALTLLMAVIQHVDNRRDNQTFYCTGALNANGVCPVSQRYLVVGDLGSTLGAFKLGKASGNGGFDMPPSLSYFFWDHAPIWQNWAGAGSSHCTVQVIAFDTIQPATLKTQQISEAGRKFLADLLSQITDTQIAQLVAFGKLGDRQAEADVTKEVWDTLIKMQPWIAPLKIVPIPFSPINAQPVSNERWASTLRKKINKVLESPCR